MTFLRTALVFAVLNLPILAQGKNPDASDVSAAIVPGGVADLRDADQSDDV